MSERNLELHRRINAAFNARDADALIDVCDPVVEVHSVFSAVGGGTYHGHQGVRRWLRDIVEAWSEFQVEAEADFEVGEHVLALVVLRGRGSVSGAEVVMPYAQVTRWRSGRCTWFKAYAHREDAFRELGVSPDALEPSTPDAT